MRSACMDTSTRSFPQVERRGVHRSAGGLARGFPRAGRDRSEGLSLTGLGDDAAHAGELKRRGLYDSSLSGFDHPYTIGDVTEVPVQWAIDDAVYFKFVGGGADSWPPSATGPILDSWLDEWTMLHKEGGLLMLTIHDWISGRAHRILMLERLLERITAEQGAWIATVGEVAAHHAASANAERYTCRCGSRN